VWIEPILRDEVVEAIADRHWSEGMEPEPAPPMA
jgi:hypothetical protein